MDENKATGELIVKGVADPQQMISDIWNTLNNRQKVSVNILMERHVYVVEYNGVQIVVIEVPRAERRDKPVYIEQDMFKSTFRRNHEGDYHCTNEEIKAMLRDQTDTTQDGLILENLDLDSLNSESIRRYRILFDNRKPDHVWSKLEIPEFLLKIGAAKKSQEDGFIHPTLGGLVFFGDFNTITDELPNYFLDYRERLSGDTRWSDRVSSGDGDWSGNIFDFYFKIIDRLTSDVKRPFQLDENLARIDDTKIHAGIRECLANSLIHADYYGRRGIVIDKEFCKITISNPGTFRIGIDEAICGGISDARNGKIFNMFSLINVGERSGSGLCDVYHVWEESGFDCPKIIETMEPERISIILEINFDANHDANDANYDASDSNLSENEKAVLKIITIHPELSATKIAVEIGISRPTVQRILQSLKKKNLIYREGTTRGKWIVM